jgi:hypothetical protein
MNYVIISGYHRNGKDSEAFASMWLNQINKHASPLHIYIIETSAGQFPIRRGGITAIPTGANCGHIGDIIHGRKPPGFCGWSASLIAGALLAYNAEADALFLEQDVIFWGPMDRWLYDQLGSDGQMIFGPKMKSSPFMACSQSVVLIRRNFIPEFVSRYLAMGNEGGLHDLPETRFETLRYHTPDKIKTYSWHSDRERPIQWEQEVASYQKLTPEEMDEAKRRGLL